MKPLLNLCLVCIWTGRHWSILIASLKSPLLFSSPLELSGNVFIHCFSLHLQTWLFIHLTKHLTSSCSQGECGWRKGSCTGGGQVCEDPKCKGECIWCKKSPNICIFIYNINSVYVLFCFCLVGLGDLGVVCRWYPSQQDVYSPGSAFSCLMSLLFISCVELTQAHAQSRINWETLPVKHMHWHSLNQDKQ